MRNLICHEPLNFLDLKITPARKDLLPTWHRVISNARDVNVIQCKKTQP